MTGSRTMVAATRVLTAVLLTLQLAVVAGAQSLPETPMLTQWMRSGRLKFDMVHGRVTFGGALHMGNSTSRSSGNDRSEQLSIRMAGNGAAITYELSLPAETLAIDFDSSVQLRIRRTPKGQSAVTPVDFLQAVGKPISLAVGPEGKQQVHQAASIWHLILADPDLSRQHLVPLLRPLRPEADLVKTAGELEAELVRIAGTQEPPDRKRWAALVDQLADERFARREAADRQLRQAGQSVLGYLRGLNPARLDAEQQFRVRRIIQTLSKPGEGDDAPGLAEWLSGDPKVWLILLSREQEATRRAAAQRLEALLGQSIPFDPAAVPEVRTQQIQKLRSRIPGA
jgi:hypothetical protein